MLKVENLEVQYGAIRALRGISFEVNSGEIISLIGSNGAGKTTTMHAISNIINKKGGKVTFNGEDITSRSADEIVRAGLVQVPEGRRIFANLSVRENLDMGAYLRHDRPGIAADIEKVFVLFPRLKERLRQLSGTLSGGEQQMLAISRALMARPKLLLLDEPSLGLAPIIIQQIFSIIQKVNENGTTVFLVEQNANQALRIANHGYVMENGRIVMRDTAANLLSSEEVRTAYLGM